MTNNRVKEFNFRPSFLLKNTEQTNKPKPHTTQNPPSWASSVCSSWSHGTPSALSTQSIRFSAAIHPTAQPEQHTITLHQGRKTVHVRKYKHTKISCCTCGPWSIGVHSELPWTQVPLEMDGAPRSWTAECSLSSSSQLLLPSLGDI